MTLRLRTAARRLLVVFVAGLCAWAAYRTWARRGPTPPTDIFRGIVYGCERLDETAEGSGLVHWVRVDLAAPGIDLYVTPVDPGAKAQGYEYRLDWASAVARREGLAVVVNGAMFSSDSGVLPAPGDLARGVETVVADGQPDHFHQYSYLLWFDDRLAPRLENKPPPDDALRRARWGIGSELAVLTGGKINAFAGHVPEPRTVAGIDPEKRLLWLAVFEKASGTRAAEFVRAQGARDAVLLDCGHSTTMVLGQGAAGVRPGTLLAGWRPVATFFGVRALPVDSP